ncbi:conserved hypothetical protein [Prochlorococcus marinus str. MIT 9515]|uniref:Fluoride-specific ion channel FluC n=1 Tax=Prochlorococcus marinus (strain MIT 9515) TaxID=167542 RepID=FLUC_PROM5|nr:CrcB family protein [Prochlorococcus marinus]A2BZ16.1 RecName: Full=Fluoride-specific ion channel FluC [Prochlorococcus marinus str. MIT 9515]ABM73027.1 conserved hypothetical protein [Prochlorococcus marinus str. MIT 9515]
MNKIFFFKILLFAYLASFLRFFLNNNLLVGVIGSFVYGFVISRRVSKLKKEILLTGFCSCFTSFSGFVLFLYEISIQGYFLKLFFYLNIIIVLNLIIMYAGFLLGRKVT